MNMASSRSHCIFTVSIESREESSSIVKRSKLHLVDLAGSERVHKTNSSGQLFREASHINRSLHFLEMVIVALQEQRKGIRTHIPYRNSMMTSVLRDSLGGNCKTTMIATVNPEPEHTDESITTCRFAQRVARVQNSAIVNVETDPTLVIRQLKGRVAQLEAEIAFLKGDGRDRVSRLKGYSGCVRKFPGLVHARVSSLVYRFVDAPLSHSVLFYFSTSAGGFRTRC
jgi:kinesin family protein 6/9